MERKLGSFYEGAKNNEYVKTAIDTSIHIGATIALLHASTKLRIPITRTKVEPTLEGALSAIIEAPLFEEIESRFIPGAMFKENSILDQVTKFWSTVRFAYRHNYTKERKFHMDTIPAYHFAFGLMAWRIMRQRGLHHAIFAHALNNTIAVGVTMYGDRKNRKNSGFAWKEIEKKEVPVPKEWEIIEK